MIELTLSKPKRDGTSVDEVKELLEAIPFDYEEQEVDVARPELEVYYPDGNTEIYKGLKEIDEGLSEL